MLVNDNFKFLTKCEFLSETWYNIGKLIYNLSEGSNEGYRLWKMFSGMISISYSVFYCVESWAAFSPDLNLSFEDFEMEMKDYEPEPLPEGW